jgi:hypothetical protein
MLLAGFTPIGGQQADVAVPAQKFRVFVVATASFFVHCHVSLTGSPPRQEEAD